MDYGRLNLMAQDPPNTSDRILDAAMQTLINFGIRRTSIETIARSAGVSHMTVRRRWRRKEDVVLAVITREMRTLFAAVDEQMNQFDTPAEKLVESFASIYWFFRTHPLLRRELDTDPESVLPSLTTAASAVLEAATLFLSGYFKDAGIGAESDADPEDVAELFVRLSQSLILTPLPRRPINSRKEARDYAERFFLPLVPTLRTTHRPPGRVPVIRT